MKKKTIIFLAICFGISLLSAGLFHFLGGDYTSLPGTLFASGYMFIPLVSVLLTQLISREKPFSGCGVSFNINWWWLAGILGMQVFVLLTLPVSALMPGVAVSSDNDLLTSQLEQVAAAGLPLSPAGFLIVELASAIIAAATVNALFAFGEEVAWRGFLSRCLDGLGFWKKSLLVGAIWGVWHAPIILMGHNYPSHPVGGVFMMIAFCMLFAPMIQLIRDKSKSVIAAAMMHGSLNAFAGLALLYLSGFNELTCGACGAAGFAIMLVTDIVIALCRRRKAATV